MMGSLWQRITSGSGRPRGPWWLRGREEIQLLLSLLFFAVKEHKPIESCTIHRVFLVKNRLRCLPNFVTRWNEKQFSEQILPQKQTFINKTFISKHKNSFCFLFFHFIEISILIFSNLQSHLEWNFQSRQGWHVRSRNLLSMTLVSLKPKAWPRVTWRSSLGRRSYRHTLQASLASFTVSVQGWGGSLNGFSQPHLLNIFNLHPIFPLNPISDVHWEH